MTAVVLKGLRARPLRTVLSGLAVVLGVAMIAGTYVLTDTINRSFENIFAQANSGLDVTITGREADKDFSSDPRPIDERVLERVRAVDGVAAASGSVFDEVSIRDKQGDRIGTAVPNFATSVEPEPFEPFDFVTGHPPRTPTEVVLDAGTATEHGFAIGDRVTIAGDKGAQRFDLVGTARFGEVDNLAGAPVAILQLPTAQALTGHEGELNSIGVTAEDGVTPAQLRDRVRIALAGEPLTVRTGAEEADKQASDLESEFSFLRIGLLIFGGIALFVGAFVIYNTFSITVAQRTRELALLRTLGASRRQVLRSVMLEAAVVGVVASLLGLAGGLLVAPGLRALIDSFGGELPAEGSVVVLRTVVVSLLVGVLVTLAASIVPALRSTRIAPVIALREGLTAVPRGGRRRLIFATLVVVVGAGVFAYALVGGGSGGSVAATMGAGAVLVFFGVALLSPQLVRPLAWLVGAPMQRVAGITGRLARENATRNPGRTAATAAALMVGVALVAFVSIFAAGLQGSIDRSVDRSFAGDLAVVDKTGFGETPAALAGAVRGVPGVAALSGVRFTEAKVRGRQDTTSVVGIDPADLAQTYNLQWRDGSDATLGRLGKDGIVADTGFDEDVAVGDRVALLTPAGRRVTYTVRGVLDEGGNFGLLGGGLVVPNALLARDFDETKDAFVFLRYTPAADPAAVRSSIDRLLAARFPDAETQNREQVKEEQAGQIDQLLYMIYALLGLAVIVSLFGIVNTLALSIFERTRELGLLRAIGTSRRQVKRTVRLEAVITSLIGAVLGLVLGVLFALAISRPLESEGFTLSFPVVTLAVLLVAAAVAGVVASLWPARRAARLRILEALAYE